MPTSLQKKYLVWHQPIECPIFAMMPVEGRFINDKSILSYDIGMVRDQSFGRNIYSFLGRGGRQLLFNHKISVDSLGREHRHVYSSAVPGSLFRI